MSISLFWVNSLVTSLCRNFCDFRDFSTCQRHHVKKCPVVNDGKLPKVALTSGESTAHQIVNARFIFINFIAKVLIHPSSKSLILHLASLPMNLVGTSKN